MPVLAETQRYSRQGREGLSEKESSPLRFQRQEEKHWMASLTCNEFCNCPLFQIVLRWVRSWGGSGSVEVTCGFRNTAYGSPQPWATCRNNHHWGGTWTAGPVLCGISSRSLTLHLIPSYFRPPFTRQWEWEAGVTGQRRFYLSVAEIVNMLNRGTQKIENGLSRLLSAGSLGSGVHWGQEPCLPHLLYLTQHLAPGGASANVCSVVCV